MIALSQRLARIAAQVPEGSRVADIGSDHALLPVFLVQRAIAVSAVAGELNPGPYAAAQRQVGEAGLTSVIEVRRGDGLEVIRAGEVDVVTIAGMGGSLIAQILENGREKLAGVKRLVLQPNVGEEFVRRWLERNDWLLIHEAILEEDGKIYEVLTAVAANDAAARNAELYREKWLHGVLVGSELLFAMGPFLLEQGSDVFSRKWLSESEKLAKIVRGLDKSETESAIGKKREMERDIAKIAEVLLCLQKAKPLSN